MRAAAFFALLGGGAAWSAQLWLGYALGDFPCRAGATGQVLGVDVAMLWYGVSLAAGVVALAAVAAGVVSARRADADDEARALRWLALIGAAASLVFLAAIVLGALGPLFVPCG